MINSRGLYFELITTENIHELKPGEWIWDNKMVERRPHKCSLFCDKCVQEPAGFRQIHIIDLETIYYGYYSKPFMLSIVNDENNLSHRVGYTWTILEPNRFYRIVKEKENA